MIRTNANGSSSRVVFQESQTTAAKTSRHKKLDLGHGPGGSTSGTVLADIARGLYNFLAEKFFLSGGQYTTRLHLKREDQSNVPDHYHRYDFAFKDKVSLLERYKYQKITIHNGAETKDVYVNISSVAKRLNISLVKATEILKKDQLAEKVEEKYGQFRDEIRTLSGYILPSAITINEVNLNEKNRKGSGKERLSEQQLTVVKEKSEAYAKWMKGVLGANKKSVMHSELTDDEKRKIENVCRSIAWVEATYNVKEIRSYSGYNKDAVQAVLTYHPEIREEMRNAYRAEVEGKKSSKA